MASLPYEDNLPTTITHLCGYCGKDTWFALKASTVSRTDELDALVAALYHCPGCYQTSLMEFWIGPSYPDGPYLSRVLPHGQATPWPELPEEIRADHAEAWNCFHSGQYKAAVLMGRAALQRAVRHLGAEGRDLNAELDSLVTKGVVTAQIRANADEVRLSGNDAAHPERTSAVSSEDARDSLAFLDDFLNTTEVLPARQQARKASRGSG
jgi:hypothetical protein